MASQLILDAEPGTLDRLLEQSFGNAVRSPPPTFGEDILAVAEELSVMSESLLMEDPEAYEKLCKHGMCDPEQPEKIDTSLFMKLGRSCELGRSPSSKLEQSPSLTSSMCWRIVQRLSRNFWLVVILLSVLVVYGAYTVTYLLSAPSGMSRICVPQLNHIARTACH